MNKNKINIVKEKESNSFFNKLFKNKKITILIIVVFVILIGSIVTLCIINPFNNKNSEDYKSYEQLQKIYESQDIDYSYDDYKIDTETSNKDKDSDKSSEEGKDNSKNEVHKSTPAKTLEEKNDSLLKSISEDTLIDTTSQEVENSIIDQTKKYNDFINSHLGYPEDEYDEDYDGVRNYIDSLIKSLDSSNTEEIYNFYDDDVSLENQQAGIRASIFENYQYDTGDQGTQYNDILYNYMLIGHPQINNIQGLSIEKYDKTFDNAYQANLKATFVSNGITYEAYLSSVVSDSESLYKVLDINKI